MLGRSRTLKKQTLDPTIPVQILLHVAFQLSHNDYCQTHQKTQHPLPAVAVDQRIFPSLFFVERPKHFLCKGSDKIEFDSLGR